MVSCQYVAIAQYPDCLEFNCRNTSRQHPQANNGSQKPHRAHCAKKSWQTNQCYRINCLDDQHAEHRLLRRLMHARLNTMKQCAQADNFGCTALGLHHVWCAWWHTIGPPAVLINTKLDSVQCNSMSHVQLPTKTGLALVAQPDTPCTVLVQQRAACAPLL